MTLRFAGAIVSASNPDADYESPQIPLPSAGMRLVEVIQVDDQVPFRGGVETKIAEMGITANDRADASRGQMRDVLGHHSGGAAQEPVRGGHHAADPNRDQP